MNILLELKNSSNSTKNLEEFIRANFDDLYDYLSLLNHKELVSKRDLFKSLILEINTFSTLDFCQNFNIAFISLLINASIRLGERFVFQSLYQLMNERKLPINSITKASSMYLTNADTTSILINRYDEIIKTLEVAYLKEEDNQDTAISALFNYYALFLDNFVQFAKAEVVLLRDKIWATYNNKDVYFIDNNVLEKLYKIDLSFESKPYATLQKIIDDFLGRNRTIADFDIGDYIIESNTEYAKILENVPECDFSQIQELNSKIYSKIKNDDIFASLTHGVAILTREEQLNAYVFSYGKMHNNKLLSAFEFLPTELFSQEINITDWACGQGIASISYFDFINNSKQNRNIKSIYLIEPSKIALKRASLHLHKCCDKITTLNKDIDSILDKDFKKYSGSNLHLFSNILDIDLFSMPNIIKLLSNNFKGTNYLVIASPYIDVRKTSRINSFVNHFRNNYEFEEFVSIDNRKGSWDGTNWSRVIRVFKTII